MMKALVTLLLLEWLGLVWSCSPQPGSINIARSGVATQSAIGQGLPSKANDGSRDQFWRGSNCAHTGADWQPWWRVDLMQTQNVYVIVIYGRSDDVLERMKDVEVRIGDDPNNNNPLCGTVTNYANPTTTFCCNGMAGRYVSAVIPGRSEHLTLCEVEVYNGTMTENDVCW